MSANAGAVRAGRAFVEIYADDAKLNGALNVARNKLRAFGASITSIGRMAAGIGTALVAPFIAATKVYIDAASALVDMSARTGVAVEKLSALKFAAEQSGASIETLERALKSMAVVTDKASEEGKAAVEAFDRLGVSSAELEKMTPVERFLTLADAVSKIKDPGERAAMALKVFGKSGAELLPLLAGGRAGIEALTTKAQELGLVMDGESAAAAEALGDTIDQLKASFTGVLMQVGSALIPELQKLADWLTRIGPKVSAWVGENRELVVTVAKAAAVLAAAGGSVVLLSQAITMATASAALLAPALLGLGLAVVAIEALKASEGMQAFNAEMERSIKLQGQIAGKRDKREQATLDQANAITDPEARKAFLQDKLGMSRKELAGAQSNVRTSEGNVASATNNAYKKGIDVLGFNTDADIARRNLKEAETKAQSIKDHIAELEAALADSVPGAVKAAETAPDAPGETAPDAPGSAIAKAAASLPIDGAAADLGSKLNAATASDGTFSNMAGRILEGPSSDVVNSLQQQQIEKQDRANSLLEQIAINTADEDG